MNKYEAEQLLARMIPMVSQLFYHGDPATVHGTILLVPEIKIDNQLSVPNAQFFPIDTNSWGVEVSGKLLQLDTGSIAFALAHELGHAFSEVVLDSIGLGGAAGRATEVIADLGAAYLLTFLNHNWVGILHTVDNGVHTGIFDAGSSGDHPPGKDRAHYVRYLHYLIVEAGCSFDVAAKQICEFVLEG